jgi:serine/threonine protein kinase
VVDVLGYCASGKILTIVMELMDNGSLYNVLHVRHDPLSLLQRMRMARHCALGLAHLHSKGVLHRDIKSMNILVRHRYSLFSYHQRNIIHSRIKKECILKKTI